MRAADRHRAWKKKRLADKLAQAVAARGEMIDAVKQQSEVIDELAVRLRELDPRLDLNDPRWLAFAAGGRAK